MALEQLENEQRQQLKNLLLHAPNTWWGRRLGLHQIQTYEAFRHEVPLHSYTDVKPLADRMKKGEPDVTWPGPVSRFAVSAGTTGDGKHLPVTDARLQADRRFMKKVIRSYIRRRPAFWKWLGAQASLPGTLEEQSRGDHTYTIGEISGYLAQLAPPWIRPLQVASPRELSRLPFKEKFEQVLEASLQRNLKIINGVPSWILTLFQRALRETGAHSIAEVWPDLKLLVCGGVKLSRYRPRLESLCEGLELDFIETYGASEGYFAFSDDPSRNDMRLVTSNGLFFEWLPYKGRAPEARDGPSALPLWELQTERPYIMVVSSNAGLWRYAVNDIITFTSLDPPRIEVRGRVAEMLDDFGEALYAWEAEQALGQSLDDHDISYSAFTIGGSMEGEHEPPRHHWFIQFDPSIDEEILDHLASNIDQALTKINRHYAIRRESDALGMPQVHPISQQQINEWFHWSGKRPAQAKLPRILQRPEDLEWWLVTIRA